MKIDQWTAFVESLAGDSKALAAFRSGDAKKIVELARSKGFSFTEQDVLDAKVDEQSGELSRSALESVSGGTGRAGFVG